jgi:glycoprotein endo-alpha-1,2-mannosidase
VLKICRYKNKITDGGYEHWNHKVLPHWQQHINQQYPKIGQAFDPDKGEIGANFWPERGLYSNYDKRTVTEQFLEIRDKAKVSVIVVSWWSKGGGDENSSGVDHVTPLLFQVAGELGMKIVFHLEPYKGRTALTTKGDLQHIIETYGKHPALYRRNNLPLCYVYDSYHTPAREWSEILSPSGTHTIRGTDHDHIMISLYLSQQESGQFILESKFDGFYTYFASNGFTYGSTPTNWPSIAQWANEHNLLFIPSVGPGYIDTQIRPWNSASIRERKNGVYYDDMWQAALNQHVPLISITSYNEWHEGTQIEPAIIKKGYSDYSPVENDYYLKRTAYWVNKFS